MNDQPIIIDTAAESATETSDTLSTVTDAADTAVAEAAAEAEIIPAEGAPDADAENSAAAGSRSSGDGLSIASFVCGLISVIFLPIGLIPGVLGFVMSLDAKKRGSSHSLLIAGRVMSLIGMAAMPVIFLLVAFLYITLAILFAMHGMSA